MRVRPAEEDQRDLARRLDAVDVRLDHRRAAFAVKRLHVRGRGGRPLGLVARRGSSPGREDRLDDEAPVRRLERLARLEEAGRHDRHARGLELGEVALVRAPAQDGQRVEDPGQPGGPVEELRAPLRVVPGRADDHEVEALPVDLRRVPDGRNSLDAARAQSRQQRRSVLVELGHLVAGCEPYERVDTIRLRFSHHTIGGRPRDGQDYWNRPRHDQLVRGRDRGRRACRDPERRGREDHPVRRRVRERRPAARRGAREAPAGDEPPEHDLLDQAVHGPQVRRGLGGDEDRPLRGRAGPERRRPREGRRQGVRAAGDQRDDPAEAEGRRRGVPRRGGHRGGGHRSGLLQQRAARGDQGRRQDRRSQRPADHQRAHRRRARVRPRQGDLGPHDPRLRPRRRDVRRLDPRARRGRLRGEGDERRQPPRRRQLRQGDRRLDGGRVQARPGHRPLRGQDGPPASLRGGREGEDRALVDDDDADQPAVRHRHSRGPEAPRPAAHAREAERAHRPSCSSARSSRPRSAWPTPGSTRPRSTTSSSSAA